VRMDCLPSSTKRHAILRPNGPTCASPGRSPGFGARTCAQPQRGALCVTPADGAHAQRAPLGLLDGLRKNISARNGYPGLRPGLAQVAPSGHRGPCRAVQRTIGETGGYSFGTRLAAFVQMLRRLSVWQLRADANCELAGAKRTGGGDRRVVTRSPGVCPFW